MTATIEGVVIVGAGYAGLASARAARRTGANVTIIDDRARHDFTTRLAGVAGGTVRVADASTALDFAADRVIQAGVVGLQGRTLRLSDGTEVCGEATVLTVGSQPTHPPIEGIDEALTLRTAADALILRARIERDQRPLVIVGAGASGVQLAGAVSAAHTHRSVTVVEMAGGVLPGMGPRVRAGAMRVLVDRQVRVLTDTSVSQITSQGVRLESGHELEGTAVWAAGFEARADALGATLTDDGRVVVDTDLSVLGMERVFAAGGIAAHHDADGSPLPMSAQIAEQAGAIAGRNAARVVAGEATVDARLRNRGWVLDLGGGRGVAQLGPVALAGPVLDRIPPVLHWLIDLHHVLTIAGRRGWRLRQR